MLPGHYFFGLDVKYAASAATQKDNGSQFVWKL
jgi:hypothetical protein